MAKGLIPFRESQGWLSLTKLLIEARARLYTRKRGNDEGSKARSIMRKAVGKWQERWQATQKNRMAFDYFDTIQERLESG